MLTREQIDKIPTALKERHQWIGWQARPKEGGKTDKQPVNPGTGRLCDVTDPENYASFEQALVGVSEYGLQGVGFVFTKDDPFTGIDLDDCISGNNIADEQGRVLHRLGSYSEISPSGKGVKAFLEGTLPGPNKNTPCIELYSHSRFFTVTGNAFDGNPRSVESRQAELEAIYWQYFPEEHSRFGELFSRCYLMKFLLEKSRAGTNLSHTLRIALGSWSVALGELDTEDVPFFTLMLSGCPDYRSEVSRKQIQSLAKGYKGPWGCEALRKAVQSSFVDFVPSNCSCGLQVKGGRRPSPIRFVAHHLIEVHEEDEMGEYPLVPLHAFPVEVFPGVYQEVVDEISRAHVVPVEIPACTLLSFTGACIGRTRGIRPKEGFLQHPNLFVAIVGRSGLGKTPAIDVIKGHISTIEKAWVKVYQREMRTHEWEVEQRKLLSKEEKRELGPVPEMPQCRQITVGDTTMEGLRNAFDSNPRGIMWARDELLGMLLSFDKYTGKEGETKSLVCSAHDYQDWKVNRVDRLIYISRPCLSIFGNTQPDLVKTAFTKQDAFSGFLPRFLLVKVDRNHPAFWQTGSVSEQTHQAISKLFHSCLEYQFDNDGQPVVIYLEEDAYRIYHGWYDKIAGEPWNTCLPKNFSSVLNKLQVKAIRLCLILHCMEAIATGKLETSPVTGETMEKAIKLAEFFKSHQIYIYQNLFEDIELQDMDPLADRIMHAIVSLENRIEGGKLATGVITDFLNAQGDERFRVTPESVGRMAKSLGLKVTRLSGGGKRAYGIEPGDLQRLKRRVRASDSRVDCDGEAKDGNYSIAYRESNSRRADGCGGCDGEPREEESSSVYQGQKTETSNGCAGCDSESREEGPSSIYQDSNLDSRNTVIGDTTEKGVTGEEVFLKKKIIATACSTEVETYVYQNEVRFLFIDTETTGLDPYNDDLVLIQVMAGDRVFLLGPDSDISRLMADKSILKVFHNACFDQKFLKCPTIPLFDIFIAERLLTAGTTPIRGLSLEKLTKSMLGIELDKSLRTTFKRGQELTQEQINYAVMDVMVLEPIFQGQKERLKEQGLIDTALLEFSIIPAVSDIELNGMLIDLGKLEGLETMLKGRIASLEEQLRAHADINYRSPDQVRKALRGLGFPVESTGIKVLERIDHPFAKYLMEHRKVSKLLSSFVGKLPIHINPATGRIHPSFHQVGTDTGRFACSKPNLQQIPKEQEWRDLFIAAPGYRILTADYNQIELRILAELSQDPVFLEAYRIGEDLHSKTAAQLDVSRDVAKTINFGICYGMSSSGLAETSNIAPKEAQSFISAYYRTYPRVKNTLDQLGLKALSSGYAETPLGRKRYFKPPSTPGEQKSIERQGRNTPIQATCADILKKAISYLMGSLGDLDAKIINLVHDEIVIECCEDTVNQVVDIVRSDMVRAGVEFIKSVPVEVDVIVDNMWRKE